MHKYTYVTRYLWAKSFFMKIRLLDIYQVTIRLLDIYQVTKTMTIIKQMRNIWTRFFKNFFQGFLSMKFLKSPCEKLLAIKNSSKFILTSILNGSCIGRAKQAINVFLKSESSIFHPSHFFYFQILAVIDLKMQLSLKRKINCHIIQKLANEAKREWSLEFIIWI